jgi:hypothetical protein
MDLHTFNNLPKISIDVINAANASREGKDLEKEVKRGIHNLIKTNPVLALLVKQMSEETYLNIETTNHWTICSLLMAMLKIIDCQLEVDKMNREITL